MRFDEGADKFELVSSHLWASTFRLDPDVGYAIRFQNRAYLLFA